MVLNSERYYWWGNFFFFVGSLLYLVIAIPVPYICWWWDKEHLVYYYDEQYEYAEYYASEDTAELLSTDACSLVNLIAALSFILDAMLYLIGDVYDYYEWNGDEEVIVPRTTLERVCVRLYGWNLPYWGDLLFLVGSIQYVGTAILWWWYADEWEVYFFADIAASHTFLVDSLVYLAGWYAQKVALREEKRMFVGATLKWSGWDRVDWDGWGNWFFVLGSVLYVYGAYECYYFWIWNGYGCDVVLLAAAVCFVVDSLFYFAHYHFNSEEASTLLAAKDQPSPAGYI